MKSARFSWSLHLVAALLFGFIYLLHTDVLNIADPRLLAHFAAHKPYQLRVLMPLVLWFGERCGLEIVRGCQLLSLGSAVAVAVLFRRYLSLFVAEKVGPLSLSLWPFLLIFFSHHWFYLYDLPSMAFLLLGLTLLQKRKWTLFGVTLFFATLNRESSVLLVFAFAATYFAPRDPVFLRRLALYSAIWLGVKLGLSLTFAGSAGPNLEIHLAENLAFLGRPAGWDWGFWLSLLAFGALLGGAFGAWRDLPRILRVTSLLSPVLVAVFVVVGVVSETRLLGEMVPLLLPAACVGLSRRVADGATSSEAVAAST